MMFKEYRLKFGLTQEQLSKLSGVGVNTISAIENEEHIPLPDIAAKLYKALDITDDDIYNYLMSFLDTSKVIKTVMK